MQVINAALHVLGSLEPLLRCLRQKTAITMGVDLRGMTYVLGYLYIRAHYSIFAITVSDAKVEIIFQWMQHLIVDKIVLYGQLATPAAPSMWQLIFPACRLAQLITPAVASPCSAPWAAYHSGCTINVAAYPSGLSPCTAYHSGCCNSTLRSLGTLPLRLHHHAQLITPAGAFPYSVSWAAYHSGCSIIVAAYVSGLSPCTAYHSGCCKSTLRSPLAAYHSGWPILSSHPFLGRLCVCMETLTRISTLMVS